MKTKIQPLLIALTLLASSPWTFAQAVDDANTAITYQGQLSTQAGIGTNARYDLVLKLFNTSSGGSPVAGPITNTAIAVNSNGLFSTTLNFGSSPFIGTTTNYLEIAVRTNGVGAFTTLTPRQLLTYTPRSIYALNAGTAAIATTATNFSGFVAGDVAGPQGATVVAAVGGQTAANVASGVLAANAATSANTPNTLVKRDGTGSLAAGSATLDGNLYLPSPAVIYSGSNTMFIEEGSVYIGAGAGSADFLRGIGASDLFNVGVGDGALNQDNVGKYNTAIGEQALQFNTTGSNNTAGGYQSLQHNTTGSDNKADGFRALYSNTTGSYNTANGSQALYANNSGFQNTANGYQALLSNTVGYNNSVNGYQALYANTSGYANTANGTRSLFRNLTGNGNTANGDSALYSNLGGNNNTANGLTALYSNTTGGGNTASGVNALFSNTTGEGNTASGSFALASSTGSYNTADGANALLSNTTGYNNTANGMQALYLNTSGSFNTASGFHALFSNTNGYANTASGEEALLSNTTGIDNTASGAYALQNNSSGANNIALGYAAGLNLTTGNNNIYIGNQGTGESFSSAENSTIRIGTVDNVDTNGPANTYIAGIYDANVCGVPVIVDQYGHLGTVCSSARYKQNIQSMADSSEVLLSLRPVTYQYKPGLDPKGIPQFGLVAEEVDQIDPDLVVHDDRHGIYTVRYEAVNAMLLNEFLKQHRKVEDQSAEIAALRAKAGRVDALEQRLSALEKLIQPLETAK